MVYRLASSCALLLIISVLALNCLILLQCVTLGRELVWMRYI